MMLLNKIKDDQFAARKAKDTVTATLLTTLYSEALMVGKNAGRETSDDEVLKVIQKFLKGVNETIVALQSKGGEYLDKVGGAILEKCILEAYLPKQITEVEIIAELQPLIASGVTSVGDLMKSLKSKYGAALDGKTASALIKTLV
jgi:uncharacterized protein YqeY